MSMAEQNVPFSALTPNKVQQWLLDASPAARSEIAASVAAEYAKGRLGERERRIAIKILEILARDVEQEVREAFADYIEYSPKLPQSIVRKLVRDVETVALPIIRHAEALTDADLLAIVRDDTVTRQVAVAVRRSVGPEVADALVKTGARSVVIALLANSGADITDDALFKTLDDFAEDEFVHLLVVKRPTLPLAVAARLISLVSSGIRERLVSEHSIPPNLADEFAAHGREGAILKASVRETRAGEVERLTEHLKQKGLLTATLLVRALCVGDLPFFEAGMAALASLPTGEVSQHLYSGRQPLEVIYGKTALPLDLFRAFYVALDMIKENRQGGRQNWGIEYSRCIIMNWDRAYGKLCPASLKDIMTHISRRLGTLNPSPAQVQAPS